MICADTSFLFSLYGNDTHSSTRTLAAGHRSFDILHVASALVLQADLFLTFDAKRKRLAEAEGILVPGERLTSPRAPRSAAPRAGGCS